MFNHIYDNCVALSILFKFYGLEKEDINFIWRNTWKYNDILKESIYKGQTLIGLGNRGNFATLNMDAQSRAEKEWRPVEIK